MLHRALCLVSSLLCAAPQAFGAELLRGEVRLDNGARVVFSLFGESRNNLDGGHMRMGERVFREMRVSRLGLIGAKRLTRGTAGEIEYGEFAVFSSSFSEQTAVGQPWVAALTHIGCDTAYNAFLAVYRVEGEAAVEALGDIPYPTLTERNDASRASTVYCFMAKPP